jgi:hypothetical protein
MHTFLFHSAPHSTSHRMHTIPVPAHPIACTPYLLTSTPRVSQPDQEFVPPPGPAPAPDGSPRQAGMQVTLGNCVEKLPRHSLHARRA